MSRYVRKDHFYHRAKAAGFRSRAAYKLEEINQRYQVIRNGARVLDLGCAPGGFCQVAAAIAGDSGAVAGLDIEATPPLPHVTLLRGDVRDANVRRAALAALGGPPSCVLSDMAPHTSGIRHVDHARSMELARIAFDTARATLAPRGNLVIKIFDGPDAAALIAAVRSCFERVELVRPEATRKGSIELYVVALRLRAPRAESAAP